MWIKHAKIHQLYCIFTFFLHFYEWSIFNEYKTIVYFINFCIFLFPKFLFKISDAYMIIFSGHTLLFNTLFATLEKNGTQNMVYQASVYSFIY